jgi:hypothetical protein
VPVPVGLLPLTGPSRAAVPVSPLVAIVPELGFVETPGVATTSNGPEQCVPPPLAAVALDIPGPDMSAEAMTRDIRLTT